MFISVTVFGTGPRFLTEVHGKGIEPRAYTYLSYHKMGYSADLAKIQANYIRSTLFESFLQQARS